MKKGQLAALLAAAEQRHKQRLKTSVDEALKARLVADFNEFRVHELGLLPVKRITSKTKGAEFLGAIKKQIEKEATRRENRRLYSERYRIKKSFRQKKIKASKSGAKAVLATKNNWKLIDKFTGWSVEVLDYGASGAGGYVQKAVQITKTSYVFLLYDGGKLVRLETTLAGVLQALKSAFARAMAKGSGQQAVFRSYRDKPNNRMVFVVNI